MVKLQFPSDDKRSNGKCFNRRRRWLKQGALGEVVSGTPRLERIPRYCSAVQFQGAKAGNFDIVSKKFLKKARVLCL